jgi:hypothetical protein
MILTSVRNAINGWNLPVKTQIVDFAPKDPRNPYQLNNSKLSKFEFCFKEAD